MSAKLCVVCGEALPLPRRADRRYCGVRCQVRAHRIRAGHHHGQPHVRRRTGQPMGNENEILTHAPATANDDLQQQLDEERALRYQHEVTIAGLRAQLARAEAASAAAQRQSEEHLSETQSIKAELSKVQSVLGLYKQQVQSQSKVNANLCRAFAEKEKALRQEIKETAQVQVQGQKQRRLAAKDAKAQQREWREYEKQMKASEQQFAKLGQPQERAAADAGAVQMPKQALHPSPSEVQRLQLQRASQAPRETTRGESLVSKIGTALLEGAAAAFGYQAGKKLGAMASAEPRGLPAHTSKPELVEMVPDTEDLGQRLPTQPKRPALPQKSEDYVEVSTSDTEEA